LADKQIQWSPYHFAYNNPIRFNDPDGRVPGDFYDQQGNKIGTDGKNDQKLYVVTNATEVAAAQKATANGQNLDASKMSSDILLPSIHVRSEMGEAVTASNSPSTAAGDTKGGLHEEGGYYGKNANGQEVVIDAKPGAASVPGTSGVGVDPTTPGDQYKSQSAWRSQDQKEGTFHVHPSGTPQPGYIFEQPPSRADLRNVVTRATAGITGNSYVLGAGNNTVSVYKAVNGTGTVIATFPLQQFLTIKPK
jgi:hypothetical protein